MKLEQLKSAVVITDPCEIATKVSEALEKQPDAQTEMLFDENVGTRIVKRIGDAIIEAAPLDDDTLQALCKKRGIPWIEGYAGRGINYYASDERVDRHGDIVIQNWVFNNFKKNPVMLYSHDWELPPIGSVLDWKVEQRSDKDYTGSALLLSTLFATAEQWAWADTVFRLAAAKIMRAGSVGFYPGEVLWVEDEKERADLGLGRWGYIYNKNELIEWSPCTIPANPGAHQLLMSAHQKNLLKPHDINVIREYRRREIPRSEKDLATWKHIDFALRQTWKTIFPEVKVREHTNLDEPIEIDGELEEQEIKLNFSTELVEIKNRLNALSELVTSQIKSDREHEEPSEYETILEQLKSCEHKLK
jgi:hypothetical protein